jgi:GAF domain-containing protein
VAESITIVGESKKEKYTEILPQIESLISYESDIVANLANVAAVLKETFDFFWVGFYIVKDDELVLGPFQGPLACTRIRLGKGVCGVSWKEKRSILVDNVDDFPGHIACSSQSKSEIVVPILDNAGEVLAIVDVDSDQLADFDEIDQMYLEALTKIISEKF